MEAAGRDARRQGAQVAWPEGFRHREELPENLVDLLERQMIGFFPDCGWYLGKVVDYRTHSEAGRFFRVRYTDGNEEDMLWVDLCPKLLPKQPGWKDVELAVGADAQMWMGSQEQSCNFLIPFTGPSRRHLVRPMVPFCGGYDPSLAVTYSSLARTFPAIELNFDAK
ncbi:hypothetical protein CYMTET_9557 [Cymbomonas tetramitiformis]|uniref:PTM/DIR17-like Tudor domain-containing protein n=1 Tax=Cymbomonas tetramitiformis TaxID=36881 RepID=A0AAE0GQV5_9CHLO|nr:hypothetical protein CYMTET_9557 [Cymbomonas tetramitiformis]